MLQSLYNDFLNILPKIFLGIGFIIASFIFYVSIIWLIKKLLKVSNISKLNRLINENELFIDSNIKINLNDIILFVVKFILILIIAIIGAEFLDLTIVSVQIGKLLEYLPQFFTGVIIFAAGIYLASQAKKMVYNLLKSIDSGGAKSISTVLFYLIFIFVSITALNQIGIETEIISNNISYIIGAALISATIAIGLGSRDIVYRLILGFYTKKNLQIGMKIQIDETIGVIESIDNICMVLKTENEKIVFPIKKINNSEIKVLNQ